MDTNEIVNISNKEDFAVKLKSSPEIKDRVD